MFTTYEAARLSGASFRQIDYWSRVGAVTPHVCATGSGSRRTWTKAHVERLGMIASLTGVLGRHGIDTRLVRTIWFAELAPGESTITLACDESGQLVRVRQAGLITRPLIVVPVRSLAELAAAPESWERERARA